MKKYIKPTCETIDIQVEGHILNPSPTGYKDEKGNGVWLAPKRIWGNDME